MKIKGYVFGMLIVAPVLAVSLCGCGTARGNGDATATTTVTTTTTVPTTTGTTAQAFPFVGYVNATTLNVRPTPDTSGYAIGGLKWGDAVTILSREGDWYAISFAGQTGYINAQYVQDTMPTVTTTAPSTTGTTVADATATTVAVVGP